MKLGVANGLRDKRLGEKNGFEMRGFRLASVNGTKKKTRSRVDFHPHQGALLLFRSLSIQSAHMNPVMMPSSSYISVHGESTMIFDRTKQEWH